MSKRAMEKELFKSFDIKVILVLWQGKIETTESRVDDSWRKIFDESGEAMGMKNGENMVWE